MVKFVGEDEAADDDTSCLLQFINLNILFLDIFVTYCLPYWPLFITLRPETERTVVFAQYKHVSACCDYFLGFLRTN